MSLQNNRFSELRGNSSRSFLMCAIRASKVDGNFVPIFLVLLHCPCEDCLPPSSMRCKDESSRYPQLYISDT